MCFTGSTNFQFFNGGCCPSGCWQFLFAVCDGDPGSVLLYSFKSVVYFHITKYVLILHTYTPYKYPSQGIEMIQTPQRHMYIKCNVQ